MGFVADSSVSRVGRATVVVVCAVLAFASWYMAGFFNRYGFFIGEGRHFGVWARVSQGLALAFVALAIYVWRKV